MTTTYRHTFEWTLKDVKAIRPEMSNNQLSQVLQQLERCFPSNKLLGPDHINMIADSLYIL